MKDRFLDLLLCAVFSLAPWTVAEVSAASPYEHELLGQCFKSQTEALKPFRLPDGTNDENVVASETMFAKDGTWVVDKTSDYNYQWYLLEKTARGYCYSLYVPFAAEVSSTHSKGVLIIQALTQPSPGTNSYQMTFRKSAKSGLFVPYKCTARDQDRGRARSPRYIDCLTVGDQ